MKKKHLKSLTLKKVSISNLHDMKGGDSTDEITTFRYICTNHPKQETDFCPPSDTITNVYSWVCISMRNEISCECTVA